MKADQKRDHVVASQEVLEQLEQFRRNTAGFLARLVTLDETWVHVCDAETKEQPKGWRHGGSPRPKMFITQKSASKVKESVF